MTRGTSVMDVFVKFIKLKSWRHTGSRIAENLGRRIVSRSTEQTAPKKI
jgi:hypothetical protein